MSTFRAKLLSDEGPGCAAIVPARVMKAIAGERIRVPVVVTVNGFSFRTTTFRMGSESVMIGFNKGNLAGAGVRPGQTVSVAVSLDTEPRVVAVPRELAAAFKRDARAKAAWEKLSYTHKREWAEAISGAKQDVTRARRAAKCLDEIKLRRLKGH